VLNSKPSSNTDKCVANALSVKAECVACVQIGRPFAVLQGRHGQRLVVVGLLYNMQDACEAVTVEAVEQALLQPWFSAAMARAQDSHAIVVLSHMGSRDPLARLILTAIRARLPDAPVLFLTGHTHVRDFQRVLPPHPPPTP
jgi:hypothetical protein